MVPVAVPSASPPDPPATLRRRVLQAATLALTVAAVWNAHRLLRVALEAGLALALQRRMSAVPHEALAPLEGLALAAGALFFVHRRWPASRLRRAWPLAALLYALPGYALSMHGPKPFTPLTQRWAPGLWVYDSAKSEQIPLRGQPGGPLHRESTNRHGFRVPDWSEAHPAGVVRGVTLGDSYVYGVGVEDGDTLADALARELTERGGGTRYEVLNLGMPGTNLGSHVAMLEAALDRLAPDFVVLCLTLPNDLTRWDVEVARADLGRPSALSLATFLLGGRTADVVWYLTSLVSEYDDAGERFLAESLGRVVAVQAAHGNVPLVVFSYDAAAAPGVARLFPSQAHATVVVADDDPPENHIPNDGHPTARGNRAYAARIAARFFEVPSLRDLRAP